MNDKKSVPAGVQVIAVLYYLGAVLGVLFGLLLVFGAGKIGSFGNQIPLLGVLGAFALGGVLVAVGIILISLGVFSFFVGRGLWKGRGWARIVAIIFAALGILISLISMIRGHIFSNLFNLIIQLLIGGYLLFSNNVKQAFG